MTTPAAPATLEVLELGVTDYAEALALQRRLAEERARGRRPDTLILLEHPAVVTLGSSFREATLKSARHPVVEAERGGGVTFHGPGQLVGYPIVRLDELPLARRGKGLVGLYLRALEGALIAAMRPFGLAAFRRPGLTGVWAGETERASRKLASIGVAVRSWVAYHGFALNVSTDLSDFDGLYPCGLEPGRMTSLAALLGEAPPMEAVRRSVRDSLSRALHGDD